MQPGLMEQGLTLMLVGMGTVFVFLTLLVGAVTLMSWLTARLAPGPVAEARGAGIGDDEVAAIGAAIAAHRRRSR